MKHVRLIAAGALLMLLSSCFLQPGKFTSAMSVMKDGSFTYAYTGEIHLFTYKKMMEEMMKDSNRDIGEFNPDGVRCWDDQPVYDSAGAAADAAADAADAAADATDTASDAATAAAVATDAAASLDEGRECTAEELAQKKKEWDEERAAGLVRAEEDKKQMAEIFGGIDPSDPKTLDEFARRLQGQEGWIRVSHRGEGVFDVDYRMAGRLDHDFVFPVYPGLKYIIPFVQVTKRKDGRVAMQAPAFVGSAQGQEGANIGMAGMAMMGAGKGSMGGMSFANGTFTLTTDAEILTNNTQDGPSEQNGMKVLSWIVGPLDSKVPEALLKL